MSRITKQIAEDTAKAMTAEKRKAANDLKSIFEMAVSDIAWERVPDCIRDMSLADSTKNYIVKRAECQLHGNGFEFKWVNFPSPIPFKYNESLLNLSSAEGKVLWNLENDYKKAKQDVDNLKEEIYITLLYTLKTFKKVQDHFPEAYEFLPKTETPTSLAINLDALRHKIQKP